MGSRDWWEGVELSHWGLPKNYDGQMPCFNHFYIGTSVDIVDLDLNAIEEGRLSWVIIPTATRAQTIRGSSRSLGVYWQP